MESEIKKIKKRCKKIQFSRYFNNNYPRFEFESSVNTCGRVRRMAKKLWPFPAIFFFCPSPAGTILRLVGHKSAPAIFFFTPYSRSRKVSLGRWVPPPHRFVPFIAGCENAWKSAPGQRYLIIRNNDAKLSRRTIFPPPLFPPRTPLYFI